jgi:hypothetical protein
MITLRESGLVQDQRRHHDDRRSFEGNGPVIFWRNYGNKGNRTFYSTFDRLGTIIPLATEYAEAGGQKKRKYKKKERNWKGVKKYSKRWWQLYRAQERRKKQVAARKRAFRLRQLRLEKAPRQS